MAKKNAKTEAAQESADVKKPRAPKKKINYNKVDLNKLLEGLLLAEYYIRLSRGDKVNKENLIKALKNRTSSSLSDAEFKKIVEKILADMSAKGLDFNYTEKKSTSPRTPDLYANIPSEDFSLEDIVPVFQSPAQTLTDPDLIASFSKIVGDWTARNKKGELKGVSSRLINRIAGAVDSEIYGRFINATKPQFLSLEKSAELLKALESKKIKLSRRIVDGKEARARNISFDRVILEDLEDSLFVYLRNVARGISGICLARQTLTYGNDMDVFTTYPLENMNKFWNPDNSPYPRSEEVDRYYEKFVESWFTNKGNVEVDMGKGKSEKLFTLNANHPLRIDTINRLSMKWTWAGEKVIDPATGNYLKFATKKDAEDALLTYLASAAEEVGQYEALKKDVDAAIPSLKKSFEDVVKKHKALFDNKEVYDKEVHNLKVDISKLTKEQKDARKAALSEIFSKRRMLLRSEERSNFYKEMIEFYKGSKKIQQPGRKVVNGRSVSDKKLPKVTVDLMPYEVVEVKIKAKKPSKKTTAKKSSGPAAADKSEFYIMKRGKFVPKNILNYSALKNLLITLMGSILKKKGDSFEPSKFRISKAAIVALEKQIVVSIIKKACQITSIRTTNSLAVKEDNVGKSIYKPIKEELDAFVVEGKIWHQMLSFPVVSFAPSESMMKKVMPESGNETYITALECQWNCY